MLISGDVVVEGALSDGCSPGSWISGPNISSVRQALFSDNIRIPVSLKCKVGSSPLPRGKRTITVQDNPFLCRYLGFGYELSWESSGRNGMETYNKRNASVMPVGS